MTDPQRVVLLQDGAAGLSMREEYVDVALRGGASAILTSHPGDFSGLDTGGVPVRKP